VEMSVCWMETGSEKSARTRGTWMGRAAWALATSRQVATTGMDAAWSCRTISPPTPPVAPNTRREQREGEDMTDERGNERISTKAVTFVLSWLRWRERRKGSGERISTGRV
jgi:hypothetical protein